MKYFVRTIASNVINENNPFLQKRMTTFIKVKLKKSDDHTNIDKYSAAANITKYHIRSKLFFRRIPELIIHKGIF